MERLLCLFRIWKLRERCEPVRRCHVVRETSREIWTWSRESGGMAVVDEGDVAFGWLLLPLLWCIILRDGGRRGGVQYKLGWGRVGRCFLQKRRGTKKWDLMGRVNYNMQYNIENTNRFSLPLCIAICLPIAKLGITKRVIHLSTATNKMTPRNEWKYSQRRGLPNYDNKFKRWLTTHPLRSASSLLLLL